mmetsp:Transcript_21710/g.45484  ORF Transcript_21710/g.45484 Transcript_21710/m.45484 type:complete len:201 (+) Transcript_21710:1045-1647(+)
MTTTMNRAVLPLVLPTAMMMMMTPVADPRAVPKWKATTTTTNYQKLIVFLPPPSPPTLRPRRDRETGKRATTGITTSPPKRKCNSYWTPYPTPRSNPSPASPVYATPVPNWKSAWHPRKRLSGTPPSRSRTRNGDRPSRLNARTTNRRIDSGRSYERIRRRLGSRARCVRTFVRKLSSWTRRRRPLLGRRVRVWRRHGRR